MTFEGGRQNLKRTAIFEERSNFPPPLLFVQVNLKIVNCGGAYRDCIKRNGDRTWM